MVFVLVVTERTGAQEIEKRVGGKQTSDVVFLRKQNEAKLRTKAWVGKHPQFINFHQT